MTMAAIQPYFKDPRFQMTVPGRFLVRVAASALYAIAFASAFIFLLSDVPGLRAAGFLITLFLGDRIIHFGKPERSIHELHPYKGPGIHGGKVNAALYFSPAALRTLETAFQRAKLRRLHFPLLLVALLFERREIRKAFLRMDVPVEKFREALDRALKEPPTAPPFPRDVEFIAVRAFEEAFAARSAAVEAKDLFAAVAHLKDPRMLRLMSVFEIGDEDLGNALLFVRARGFMRKPFTFSGIFGEPHKIRHRVMNRAWSARPTPVLDRFGVDLTDHARRGAGILLVGHAREYRELIDILARPGNPNAIMVGEPGAGKEAIVRHLAHEIARDRVPAPLFDKRLVSLSLGSLVAGADQSMIEGRVKRVVDEVVAAGNVILYISDIHNLVRTGGAAVGAADVLLPAMKGDQFSVVGATYPREFRQYIEPMGDFGTMFQVIRLEEISEREAINLLVYESMLLEREYGVSVSFKAVKHSVLLARKYFRQKLLPSSARELLEEAFANAREGRRTTLTMDDVVSVAERRVNVPIHEVEEHEAEKLLDLERVLHERFVGQEEAVGAVARAVREYRSGLSRAHGPIASFLFVGPTGVGKTELAKLLTEIQFGDQSLMARFDMSEYQAKESLMRFIGSPDGNVRGALTDAVMERPYSLILLDEFEKAHPDILNLFLQVMDDGRLTDGLGRTANFENAIIIATSNAHSEFLKSELERGAPLGEIREQLTRKLTDYFKPELLNRFSAIVVFKNLTLADTLAIAKLQLSEFSKLLRERHGVELRADDEAVARIAELGYDPVFGARPLRKVISDRIRAALAEKILRGELKRGGNVKISVREGVFTFEMDS